MLLLSEKQVKTLIDIDELIETLERAHVQYSTGRAVVPVRLVVPLPQIQGRITSMPGFLNDDKALGMKVVTYFQENPQRGLPSILATIMLFSAETGKMIAAMDGSYITRSAPPAPRPWQPGLWPMRKLRCWEFSAP